MRKSHTNPGNTQSPNQEEPKEAHYKTHHNQNGKIQRQRENLKDRKGEIRSSIPGTPDKVISADFSIDTQQARRQCKKYSK